MPTVLNADWSVLGEYSRLSLHPLRSGFDETAYDILKLGLAPPRLELKAGRLESYLRVGHHSLFPFWESKLSEYRVRYSVSPRVRLTGVRGSRFYLDAEPTLLVLRDGDIGYEISAESGLTISSAGGSFRPYLWLRFNDDAELVANTTEKKPADRARIPAYDRGWRLTAAFILGQGRRTSCSDGENPTPATGTMGIRAE